MSLKSVNELKNNGFTILRSFLSKKIISDLLNGYKKNLDYCLKINNKKILIPKSIDEKYNLLNKLNNNLKSKSYDLSKFHPSLFRLATDRRIEKLINLIFGEIFLDYPQIRADDNKNSFYYQCTRKYLVKCLNLWSLYGVLLLMYQNIMAH